MPFGIQRIDAGMLTSQVRPPTNSARLHNAIACTLPMWLLTLRRCAIDAMPRPGSSDWIRGVMLAK